MAIHLSPGEHALIESIIVHVYPDPTAGRPLPDGRSDLEL